MKTLTIKPGTMPMPPKGDEKLIDYRELITYCLDNAPPGGFAISDIEKRMRVKKTIQESELKDDVFPAPWELTLEDHDYETLRECVMNMRWGLLHPFIYQFIQEFKK